LRMKVSGFGHERESTGERPGESREVESQPCKRKAGSSETEKRKGQRGRQHRKMMEEAESTKRTTGDDVAESSRKYAERELKEHEWMERVS
jgi:hypothetical protein